MKKFEAVLFDVDGTLLDTRKFILAAFNHSLTFHGFPEVHWDILRSTIGLPLEDCYKVASGIDDVEKFIPVHRNFQADNLNLSQPFENAKETLERLTKAGIRIGAVTSRGSHTAGRTLELAELLDYFAALITSDDVENMKPHPEPSLKALGRLNVSPKKAIMVGDTEYDILAGKNAGTSTIAVSYGFGGKEIARHNPDFMVNDIRDILPIILLH